MVTYIYTPLGKVCKGSHEEGGNEELVDDEHNGACSLGKDDLAHDCVTCSNDLRQDHVEICFGLLPPANPFACFFHSELSGITG